MATWFFANDMSEGTPERTTKVSRSHSETEVEVGLGRSISIHSVAVCGLRSNH